jgi:hypothetical protein
MGRRGIGRDPPRSMLLHRRTPALTLSRCLQIPGEGCLHDIGEAHPAVSGPVPHASKHIIRQPHPRSGERCGASPSRQLNRFGFSKVGLQSGHGDIFCIQRKNGVPQSTGGPGGPALGDSMLPLHFQGLAGHTTASRITSCDKHLRPRPTRQVEISVREGFLDS